MQEIEGENGHLEQSFEEANEQALIRCGSGPFQGILKKVGKKFGFIKCEAVEREFQKDVFVSNHVIPLGSNVIGSKVNFKLKLSEKGEPQADNLTIFSQPQRGFGSQKAPTHYKDGNSEDDKYSQANGKNGSGYGHIDNRNGNAYGTGSNNTNRLMANRRSGGNGNFHFRGVANPKNTNIFNNGNPLLSQSQQRGYAGLSHMNNNSGYTNQHNSGSINQIYSGVLKGLFPDKMYGFIACQEVHQQWGRDVFLDREEIEMAPNLTVGVELDFVLSINEKGQPVGKLLPPNGIFHGALKMYLPSRGYGFVRCPDTHRVFGSDAFIHKREVEQPPALEVGDPVQFTITLNAQGQPQAVRIVAYEGPVIVRGGFMFILCDEAKRRYGQDVFLLKSQANGVVENDQVRFDVVTNEKGQPQAQHVHRIRPHMGNDEDGEEIGGERMDSRNRRDLNIYDGTVKSVGEKYGFIRMHQRNTDVFFLMNSSDPIQVGDELQFNVAFNEKNQLQARNVVKKEVYSE